MNYKYDVAISYQSEMEEKAALIKDYLETDGWNVFFAPDRQQELLSEKIHQMLYGIYKNDSFLKVLLVSKKYLESEWTSLEKRVSLESTKEDRMRLLIINYTDSLDLPKELQQLIYLDGHNYKEDEIASLINDRLRMSGRKNKKQADVEKRVAEKRVAKKKKPQMSIKFKNINDHGVILGDHATLGDIHLGN